MKHLTLTLFFVFVVKVVVAQSFEWAKRIEANNCQISSVAVDKLGNFYTTGSFKGTVDFDLGTNVFHLTTVNTYATFILKLDSQGNFVWAKQIGDTIYNNHHRCNGRSIKIDTSGNIYITGDFTGTVDFDPGPSIFSLSSVLGSNLQPTNDIFIAKLDSLGNFVYAKQFGGTSADIGTDIAVDVLGNSYITGFFALTADFDPGPDTLNFTAIGWRDMCIVKLDTGGNLVYAKQVGGPGNLKEPAGISVDSLGNVYTAGYFEDTVDFDPGPNTFNLIPSSLDIYILKLDSIGNFLWAKQIGGGAGSIERAYDSELDILGNIYTTGYITDTTDFDPGIGVYNLSGAISGKAFISKLDKDGNFVWAKTFQATEGTSLTIDALSNIYITGNFSAGSHDFDPGPNVFNLHGAGLADIYMSKLDANGNFVWAKGMGSPTNDFGYCIVVDANYNVCTVGDFSGTVDFDPGSGIFNLTYPAAGFYYYPFIQTMSQCITSSTLIQAACNTFSLNGHAYTTSGTYFQTVNNIGSCDSTIVLSLTITHLNTAVTQNGATLTANDTNATYQWIDCNGNTPIPNATNQTFIPTVIGNYAVIVTENSCSDTSTCYLVTSLAMQTNALQHQIIAYPNPTDGLFNIDLGNSYEGIEVTITDLIGKRLWYQT